VKCRIISGRCSTVKRSFVPRKDLKDLKETKNEKNLAVVFLVSLRFFEVLCF